MLRKKVLEVTEKATASQALKRITADYQLVDGEHGIQYVMFSAELKNKKPVPAASEVKIPVFRDPFAKEHLEQELFLTQVHDTHNLVLNKFQVVEEHVVLPTIEYEEQETRLNLADFRAMWTSMEQLDAFAFFNCGYESGASQPHKHMQLISYPSMKSYTNQDMPPLLLFIHEQLKSHPWDAIVRLNELPFHHLVHRLDLSSTTDTLDAAKHLHANYERVLERMNATKYPKPASYSTSSLPIAYNLLLTKSFLLMVPRKMQSFMDIEVNSIGFIGSFLVRTPEQLAFMQDKSNGPMALLQQVTFPPNIE